jgi:butyryl-CoA dehydrogenase
VGIAQAAMDEAVNYAQERIQFNKTLSEMQAIQWMIADMATEIEAGRLLVYEAAHILDSGDRSKASKHAAMAKLFASEMCNRVTHKALQIFGGYGYVKEFPMERLYRDARITEIYEGTSEVQRLVIAANTLKARRKTEKVSDPQVLSEAKSA